MARRLGCSMVAIALGACGGPSAPVETMSSPRPGPVSAGDEPAAIAASERGVVVRPAPSACVLPSSVSDRDAAIDLLLRGRALEASSAFETLLRARPWDLAALNLHAASVAVAQAGNAGAASVAEGVVPIALQAPSLDAPATGAAATSGAAPPTRLRQLSVERNLITDDEAWLATHPPVDRSDASRPPSHVASSFQGQSLEQLFLHADHAVALYSGSRLVASAEGKQPRAFSLVLAASAPEGNAPPLEITFAQLVGETLLVQLAYNGYAALSGGRNGYLVAFDAGSGRVRWVSPALSANGGNFVVLGRSVISGYGFTAEPDFVFNFDLDGGAVLQKLPVKSGPDTFVVEGPRMFVRTYDMDYVFAIEGPTTSPAQAAALAASPQHAEPATDPRSACHVKAGAAAIDARDPAALERAVNGMRADAALSPWLETVLHAATDFVRELGEGRRVDLWKVPPVVVPAPPWQRKLIEATAALPSAPAPKLVRVSGVAASPVRHPDPPPFLTDQPYFIAPVENGRLPVGAPDLPTHYGLAALSAIIPSGEHTLLIYAGRYLAVLRSTSVEQLFDLGALRDPPKANPQWKRFASQDATYAQVVDGTLYVCNGGGSYAREVFGKKGFVTALELATGALRWRSDALRCNATFAVSGDYLVTGYGFTDEPDNLFLMRMADGATAGQVKLESGPDLVTRVGQRVHVEAYGHVYDFELQ
jgi:hypothetical protein